MDKYETHILSKKTPKTKTPRQKEYIFYGSIYIKWKLIISNSKTDQ